MLTEEQIKDGNETISGLMNRDKAPRKKIRKPKYHTDWNLLMGACKKFESLRRFINDKEIYINFRFHSENIDEQICRYDIDGAFMALVIGIKRLNKDMQAI